MWHFGFIKSFKLTLSPSKYSVIASCQTTVSITNTDCDHSPYLDVIGVAVEMSKTKNETVLSKSVGDRLKTKIEF